MWWWLVCLCVQGGRVEGTGVCVILFSFVILNWWDLIVYRFVFEQLTCKLVKVLVELVPVPVLGDVAHEEPVVVVRDGHAHLPAFADLTTIELSSPNGRTQYARTDTHKSNQKSNR